jgi:hypothetical protein
MGVFLHAARRSFEVPDTKRDADVLEPLRWLGFSSHTHASTQLMFCVQFQRNSFPIHFIFCYSLPLIFSASAASSLLSASWAGQPMTRPSLSVTPGLGITASLSQVSIAPFPRSQKKREVSADHESARGRPSAGKKHSWFITRSRGEEEEEEETETDLVRGTAVVLKHIVVFASQCSRNLFGNREKLRHLAVGKLVQLCGVVWVVSRSGPGTEHHKRESAHLGITSAWPLLRGPMSRNANLSSTTTT